MLTNLLQNHRGLVRSYFSLLGGSVARLIISLLYFISLANSLSLVDFGLFATASAVGVVLSRVVSFGFVSPLYRVATVKSRLLGTYYTGFLLAALLSLPLLCVAGWIIFKGFFSGQISLQTFTLVIIAEALLWRSVEVIVIVNNGLNLFGRAAFLVVIGTIFRAALALIFALSSRHDLDTWAQYYILANALAFGFALILYLPRRRLRLRPRLYIRRIRDSLSTSGAEILFYVQMELDKLAVLSIGGAELAGIYAIVMRLADLTAVPIRSFNMLLVQHLMRTPVNLRSIVTRTGIELLIFVISTGGFFLLSIVLWIYPNALGRNVSVISSLLFLTLAVPGFRNVVEYHAELLYARSQTGIRMLNLGLLAALKILLLTFVLTGNLATQYWLLQMNFVFALLWACSALLTHSAMRLPTKRI